MAVVDGGNRVVVDGGGSEIKPTAPMVVSPTVAAVDGGGKDGVFITNSHNDDYHPCSPSDKDWTAGWRVRRDASDLLLPRSLSLVLSLSPFVGRWCQGQRQRQ